MWKELRCQLFVPDAESRLVLLFSTLLLLDRSKTAARTTAHTTNKFSIHHHTVDSSASSNVTVVATKRNAVSVIRILTVLFRSLYKESNSEQDDAYLVDAIVSKQNVFTDVVSISQVFQ